MKRSPAWLLIASFVALAACNAQNGTPTVPAGLAPLRAAGLHRAPVLPSSRKHTGRAQIVVRIPMKKNRRGALRPAYVSPFTKSIAIAVDGGTPTIVNLTSTSPNCHFVFIGVFQYLTCTIQFTVLTGSHVFSLITYDGTNGTGSQLSANTNVPFTVVSGSNAPLSVTMGGIAHSISMTVAAQPQIKVVGANLTLYGSLQFGVTIAPVDAHGWLILGGPGAPTPKITPPAAAPVIWVTPPPSIPDIWAIQSTYSATNPTVPATFTMTAVATPVPNSGGTTVSQVFHVSLYQPWVYVSNWSDSRVGVTDELGNSVLPPSPSPPPFASVPEPSGIAYDPHNKWPYIPSIDDNFVCVYDVVGNAISVPGSWSGLSSPYGIAYVSAGGLNRLYITNFGGGSPAVTTYDENGTQQTLPGIPFAAAIAPHGIAYDSHNGNLYISDDEYSTIYEYGPQGNFIAQFGSSLPLTTYAGITYDPDANLLYAVDQKNSKIVAFDESGNVATQPGTFPNLSNPEGIVYDPYDRLLYVADSGNDDVRVYSELGAEQPQSGFPSNGTNPWGIAVVQ